MLTLSFVAFICFVWTYFARESLGMLILISLSVFACLYEMAVESIVIYKQNFGSHNDSYGESL